MIFYLAWLENFHVRLLLEQISPRPQFIQDAVQPVHDKISPGKHRRHYNDQ